MTKPIRNIVWLKRDLRSQDHAPVFLAEKKGEPYLIVYLFEPGLMDYRDTSERHLQFVYGSLLRLNESLKKHGAQVSMLYENATDVFSTLISSFRIGTVWSYQESGILQTWQRDKRVKQLFDAHGIEWVECQRDGIQRGRTNRRNWEKQWFEAITSPVIRNTYDWATSDRIEHPFELPEHLERTWSNYPKDFQPPGEKFAWNYLTSFVQERGKNYARSMSKPSLSRRSCGRISPYLAWGNISIRQAYQFVRNHPFYAQQKHAMNGFLTRLIWHCHFIQKFEMECEYELLCVNRGYECLSYTSVPEKLEAWKNGTTGYPLVDASMRCLRQTGWVNFRMRSMLVSFLCHHLDHNWKNGVYHLARLFLDYEPGIHYPQFQMQVGTTGINIVRIYNPVRQSMQHDADGVFIRRWIPELKDVPKSYIHEPWKMPPLEQHFANVQIGIDYPLPIVSIEATGRAARKKMWGHRTHKLVVEEKSRVLRTHTNSNRNAFKKNRH